MTRIAITGVGLVTALGATREESWRRMLAGECGIRAVQYPYDFALLYLFDETQTTAQSLYAEVRRLQSMLDMIYASRTWKLHTIVEKVKGR